MGYDVHITRANSWVENEGHWISADEWLKYVREDSELRLATENGEHFAIWSGPSEYPEPWLDWYEGNVYTKNPDDPLIDKMVAIANKLNAKVQGDDGEIYTGGGSRNFLSAPAPAKPTSAPAPAKSWFRRLFRGGG